MKTDQEKGTFFLKKREVTNKLPQSPKNKTAYIKDQDFTISRHRRKTECNQNKILNHKASVKHILYILLAVIYIMCLQRKEMTWIWRQKLH